MAAHGEDGMSSTAMDIAIIDDEEVMRESLRDFLARQGHRMRDYHDGASALAAFARNPPDLALLDIRMPGEDGLTVLRLLRADHPELPVIMMSGHGTMDSAIEALRSGAADFLRKPVKYPELLAALERTRRLMEVEGDRNRLRAALGRSQGPADSGFLGKGAACREVLSFLEAATRTAFDSVLITGETGSGKDVVARELHRRMRGNEAPFVAVNCPALPETLVESELFGHMKGAFTGADSDRPGAFEMADGGTLFLDELGDLSAGAQSKLLRALETRQVRRLGGRKDIVLNVTVIAATNQDLEGMVKDGAFRRDLLYRLNTFQLALPPLRRRAEDIPELAGHFLGQFAARRHLEHAAIAPAAMAALCAYHFPGNVRELRNIIERAVMLSRDGAIGVELLSLPRAAAVGEGDDPRDAVASDQPEAAQTREALNRHHWNRRAAAKALKISYEALRWRIDKYGLME
jgi:two-component system response regulator AtoC